MFTFLFLPFIIPLISTCRFPVLNVRNDHEEMSNIFVLTFPCSYRLPSLVDHHHLQHHAHPEGTQEDGLSAEKRCCPEQSLEKCQCIPGLHCSAPYCPPGSGPKLVQNSTREPGRCCPKFQCTPSKYTYTFGVYLFTKLLPFWSSNCLLKTNKNTYLHMEWFLGS